LAARDFHATAGDQEGNRAEIKPLLEDVVTFNRCDSRNDWMLMANKPAYRVHAMNI